MSHLSVQRQPLVILADSLASGRDRSSAPVTPQILELAESIVTVGAAQQASGKEALARGEQFARQIGDNSLARAARDAPPPKGSIGAGPLARFQLEKK